MAWTVLKSSIYITSLCVPLWSNHLSWVRVRCETPQLWSSWGCAVYSLSLKLLCWVEFLASEWDVDLNVGAHFWADSLLLCPYSCWWREGEKLDACKSDSVLCKMATFLCLIALCRVRIVSETLSFIKWVWELLFIKNPCVTGSIFKAYRQ